jgi:hypothetical protein
MLIETPAAPPKRHFHLLSFLLAVMNGLGLLGGLLAIFALLILATLNTPGVDTGQFAMSGLIWSGLALLVLLLPGLVYAIRRLTGSQKPAFSIANPRRVVRIGVFVWALLMVGAYFASQADGLAGALLAPLQILVIGIPIWFFVELSRRGLPGGKAHQAWGVFSAGTVVIMPLVFLVEIVLMVGVVAVAANAIMGQDALMQELNRLAMRVSSSNFNPEIITRSMSRIIRQPAVLVTILLTASGLIPLVEEFFKPLGLWTLSRKQLTPAQGFNLGMVSGAAFALVESLGFLSGVSGPDWVWTAAGRVGSGLLHITCSGLVGWGLAEAWRNKHFGRLALAYASAVALHGLWNLFGMLSGLVPFIDVTAGLVGILRFLGTIAPYALGVIGVGLFAILMLMNRHLRRQSALEAAELERMRPSLPPQLEAQPVMVDELTVESTEIEENTDGTD